MIYTEPQIRQEGEELEFKTKLNPIKEAQFNVWYRNTAKNLQLAPNPDDSLHYYDYRGYWEENPTQILEYGDPFGDKFKTPGHPTFSDQSKYSAQKLGSNIAGGRWDGKYFVHSKDTDQHADRTDEYLEGTGEMPIYEGNVLETVEVFPQEYEKGGNVSSVKAKAILRHGMIRGKAITAKQKRYFGAIAGGSKPRYESGGPISPTDSLKHQANKILQYEQLQGGPGGIPLDGSNPNLPDYSDPKYLDMLMNGVLPEVNKIMPNASAMEKGEAMDFIFNAGWNKSNNTIKRDPRAYALQEYYKKNDPSKLDKDGKWPGRKGKAYSFDSEYKSTIGKLTENDRRILMNKGRDWYYKNINTKPDGSPSDDYYKTWYGRIHNTNDYSEFNPKNPKFKYQESGDVDPPFTYKLADESNIYQNTESSINPDSVGTTQYSTTVNSYLDGTPNDTSYMMMQNQMLPNDSVLSNNLFYNTQGIGEITQEQKGVISQKSGFTEYEQSGDIELEPGALGKSIFNKPITAEQRKWVNKANRIAPEGQVRYTGEDEFSPKYSMPPFTVEADRKPHKPYMRMGSPMTFNSNDYAGGMGAMVAEGFTQPLTTLANYPAHLTSQLKAAYEGKPTDFRPTAFRPMEKNAEGKLQVPASNRYSEYLDKESPWYQKLTADILTDPWSYATLGGTGAAKTVGQKAWNVAKTLPIIDMGYGAAQIGKLGITKGRDIAKAAHKLDRSVWTSFNPLSVGKYRKLSKESYKKYDEAYNKWSDLSGKRTKLASQIQSTADDIERNAKYTVEDKLKRIRDNAYNNVWGKGDEYGSPGIQYETGKSLTGLNNKRIQHKNFGIDSPERSLAQVQKDLDRSKFTEILKSKKHSVDPEGNIIKRSNPGTIYEETGAVKVTGEEIIDFNTGQKVPVNIKSPGQRGVTKTSLVTDSSGKKTVKKENITTDDNLDNYVANEELIKAYDDNLAFVQNQLPGFKPMGSSQYHKFGVTHLTNDIDGIMKAEDWFPMASDFKSPGQAKYGPKVQLTNPNLGNKAVGEVDINLLYTDAQTGNASGGLAEELFRQFFPDDFYKANENLLKSQLNRQGIDEKLVINKTADELLAAYDPEIKSIVDAMEISAVNNAGKSKHINRGDYIMEFGDPDKVLKAQTLYAKSIMGSTADLGKQFNPKVFENYDENIKILNSLRGGTKKIPFSPSREPTKIPIPTQMAKDPKKMQIALNDYYLNNSIYSRRIRTNTEDGVSSYDDVLNAFEKWEAKGGSASGIGLNSVKLGEPGRNYGSAIGNRQFKLYDDAIETPQEYIKSIQNQTSGKRLVEKEELQTILDIANKNNITGNTQELEKLKTFESLLDLRMRSNTVEDTRNFLSDVGKELGMKAIVKDANIHGNAPYATILGNIDKQADKLKVSLQKYTPSLKSYDERLESLARSQSQIGKDTQFSEKIVKDQETFYKLRGYIQGGLEKAQERIKTLNNASGELWKKSAEINKNIKKRLIQKEIKKEASQKTFGNPLVADKKRLAEIESLLEKTMGEKIKYRKLGNQLSKRKEKIETFQKDVAHLIGVTGFVPAGMGLFHMARKSQISRDKQRAKYIEGLKKKKTLSKMEKRSIKLYNELYNENYAQGGDVNGSNYYFNLINK